MNPKAPKQIYGIREDLVSGPALVLLTPEELTRMGVSVEAHCRNLIDQYSKTQDASVLFEVAAGAAVDVIFTQKLHRKEKMTQEQFALKNFDRSARTLRDWRLSASAYADIGGVNANQPTAFSAMLALKRLMPNRRKDAWETLAAANGGKPGTGVQIFEWGKENNALIENKPVCDAQNIEVLPALKDFVEAKECLDQVAKTLAGRATISQLQRVSAFLATKARSPKAKLASNPQENSNQLEMFAETLAKAV